MHPNQNFTQGFRPGSHQQCFSPPQRFQGRALKPWPEMGNFGMGRGRMNHPRNPFPGPRPNGGNFRGNFRSSGPWSGPRPQFNQMAPCGPPGRPPFQPRTGHPQGFIRGPGYQQQKKKSKQQKVDKRDLPENNRFYCEVCDRGYKEEEKYKIHLSTHEKCPRAGCSYIAAGKLVQLHIKLQHDSGMAKKIWSLESPEEIKKWREERKKNFPTAENIAKKKALLAEKIARGEVVQEKYFGKMRGGRRGRGKWRGQNNRGGTTRNDFKRKSENDQSADCSQPKKPNIEKPDTGSEVKDMKESLGVFFESAAEDLKDDSSSDEDSSDDNDENNTANTASTSVEVSKSVTEVTAAGALGSLMSAYGVSEAETSDSEPAEVQSTVQSTAGPDPKKEPEGASVDQQPQNNDFRDKSRHRTRNRNRGKKDVKQPLVDKTLLEKLLAKEIRQERNKILQCVYYIVKKNFFDS